VSMHGTAPDSQSGMADGSAGVAWALSPGGPRTPAHPVTGSDFSSWAADLPVSGFGAHTISVIIECLLNFVRECVQTFVARG